MHNAKEITHYVAKQQATYNLGHWRHLTTNQIVNTPVTYLFAFNFIAVTFDQQLEHRYASRLNPHYSTFPASSIPHLYLPHCSVGDTHACTFCISKYILQIIILAAPKFEASHLSAFSHLYHLHAQDSTLHVLIREVVMPHGLVKVQHSIRAAYRTRTSRAIHCPNAPTPFAFKS